MSVVCFSKPTTYECMRCFRVCVPPVRVLAPQFRLTASMRYIYDVGDFL